MLEPLLSYILCGWVQFQAGHRIKGAFLLIAFPSSIALACHYLSAPGSSQDFFIGLVSLALSVLIWSFHFLDVHEYLQGDSFEKEEPEKPAAKIPGHTRVATGPSGKRGIAPLDDLYRKGRIAYLRGSFTEARDCFQQILQKDRADSDAAFQLGRVYHRLGDNRQADRFFRLCRQTPGGAKWAEEIKKYLQENRS